MQSDDIEQSDDRECSLRTESAVWGQGVQSEERECCLVTGIAVSEREFSLMTGGVSSDDMGSAV